MKSTEQEISYPITNSYSTLNSRTATTKTVWFVCHGMGYLSRYFLKYFKGLPAAENFIIAPQAHSKYYITQEFKHVGASWLTKENTAAEMDNVMTYFDAIFEREQISNAQNLIVLGYSQGVSVAMRYLASRKIKCSQLIMHSGSIPKELKKEDFEFFNGKAKVIYGTTDEYLNDDRMNLELLKAEHLFGDRLEIIPFDGVHEVNVKLINSIV
ncbi:MAG: esterase [Psychroserpens sp.]|uniref:alpha/beta hydrolase n=1 Tax=Psychroserpens sp. TaxID=2020870 RepID=UPI003C729D85